MSRSIRPTRPQPAAPRSLRVLVTCPLGRPGTVIPAQAVTGLSESMLRRYLAQKLVEYVEPTPPGRGMIKASARGVVIPPDAPEHSSQRTEQVIDVQVVEDITEQAEPPTEE